jgi:hypothetical protein
LAHLPQQHPHDLPLPEKGLAVYSQPYPKLPRWVRQLSLQFTNKETGFNKRHDLPIVTRMIAADLGFKPVVNYAELVPFSHHLAYLLS